MQWAKRSDADADLTCEGDGLRYFRRRCSSYDRRLILVVFGSLFCFSLVVALVFAVLGAWLIIPFAGLEIAALGCAAGWARRRSADFERLALEGDRIVVETGDRGLVQRFEFNRCWARLVTGADGSVALRSHGREIVIGRYCGDEGREELARELRSRLGAQGI